MMIHWPAPYGERERSVWGFALAETGFLNIYFDAHAPSWGVAGDM